MSAEETAASGELESAIAEVYGGALEDFVRRRDAVAKALRAAGNRDLAGRVKELRKPSRIAWSLNLAARDSRQAIDALVTAANETLVAQTEGGDIRTAIVRLRAAVREFASHAAQAAMRAGHPVDSAVLANAAFAVLGRPESLTQLRRGCLDAVPEAGGLDFLASLPASPPQMRQNAEVKPRGEDDVSAPVQHTATVQSAAREAASQAGKVLANARERADVSQRALREAESKVQSAELRLRQAEEETRAARDRRDRARLEAETADAELAAAAKALAETEQQLDTVSQARR